MPVLSAENLSLSFGAFDLFKGISVSIANDAKIGLIGPNGVGKTSLLLMLAGINHPTTGIIHIARGKRLGYLRQEAVDAFANRENTVYDEMLTVFDGLLEQQARLHALEAEMAANHKSSEQLDALLDEYGSLQLAFETAGGYDYDLRIQQTLSGLGLGKEHWHMPLNHLSGGQKTRALLARLLLEKPDLLMLDEPTNHLDIEAVEWLERILREWEGAVLIVSHDRYFLDSTVNTIWEMTPVGIEAYPGSYSAYLLQRQERWEYSERVFKEEKERLLKDVDFIQKNWVRASTHARALGLLRRLTRDLAIVENHGVLALRSGRKWSQYDADTQRKAERPLDVVEAIRKVNAIGMTNPRPTAIRPRLPQTITGSMIVLRAKNAAIGYPGNLLFRVKELELHRGECAALIGPNGSGKTTFLKVLLGQMEPLQGIAHMGMGSSLKVGYFAQAHDSLKADNRVIDELIARKPMSDEAARSMLAQYLFKGEDVFKPVGALSGGERARLALAILTTEGANVLLLDEPTNHLDIPAREALQAVLENYTGTILLVSHDRYLIDRLATQIWEIRDSKLEIFQGSYRQFILRKATGASALQGRKVLLSPKPMMRDNSQNTRRRALTLTQIEERINEQERTIQRLSRELEKAAARQASNDRNAFEHVNKVSWQVAQAQAKLEELMSEWESLVNA
ncbi:MAG: ABC transporter ATP-binding protein [Chloroflexota bacterium]|nr:MAG: ABC transporter ATP-binding protein [Chloroflexota bacterium]